MRSGTFHLLQSFYLHLPWGVEQCRCVTQHACVQKDGEMRPGTKGISLLPEQFQVLKGAAADVSRALQAQDTGYRLALSSK